MDKNNTKKDWAKYKKNELQKLAPVLEFLGFALDEEQVHTDGERHLMSGFKLVLNAIRKKDKAKVIIKASAQKDGESEIEHEHDTRNTIKNIVFAYRNFLLPDEILFTKKESFTISVTQFIDEKKSFLEHELTDQFFLALRALETQEGAHITTSSHVKNLNKVFKIMSARDYLDSFLVFTKNCEKNNPENKKLTEIFSKSFNFLKTNEDTIEKYANFLTHSDFVPHNLRIVNHDIYLLDHTSIQFGNKYESWARLINYMTIYNPALENALCEYVKNNREKDEYFSLQTMRIFKIGFLLNFYLNALQKTEGDLRKLTALRIDFWMRALEAVLSNKQIDQEIVNEYKKERDALRSDDEKVRQKKLKQLF